MEIWEGIQIIAGTRNLSLPNIYYAEVKSVNESERNCVVSATTMGSTTIEITADLCLLGNTGLVVIPSVGSTVLVLHSKTVKSCIIQHSYVDKILLNGNANGGVPISGDVVTRLNNIENLVNDLITKFNTHTHLGVTVGAGVTGITSTLETNTLTTTQESDISSKTIFQG